VSLQHALLATLLDGDATGYELAKRFDIAASNFWHAQRAQLYAELKRMEDKGLVSGETVLQTIRPNKRVMSITEEGLEELCRFVTEPSDRIALKDDLMVKITALDIADHDAVLADIERRRESAVAQMARYVGDVERMLHGRDEETFVRTTHRIGPYLTLLRGIALEEENIRWCETAARLVAARRQRRTAGRSRTA
jgi:DNA-binding PadR family transcriptional regulator